MTVSGILAVAMPEGTHPMSVALAVAIAVVGGLLAFHHASRFQLPAWWRISAMAWPRGRALGRLPVAVWALAGELAGLPSTPLASRRIRGTDARVTLVRLAERRLRAYILPASMVAGLPPVARLDVSTDILGRPFLRLDPEPATIPALLLQVDAWAGELSASDTGCARRWSPR